MGGVVEAATFGRLRSRLAVVIALVIAAILAVLVGAVLLLMDQVLVAQQADGLRSSALAAGDEARFEGPVVRLRSDPDEAGTLIFVWGPRGDLLAATDASSAALFAPAARAALAGAAGSRQVVVPGSHGSATFLVASEPVATPDFSGVIQAARSLAPIRAAEGRLAVLLLIAGGAGVVLAAFASWFLAGRALGPVQHAFRREREFVADASHELRTPLSVVDAGLQILDRHPDQTIAAHAETLAAMRSQARRMTGLLSALLTLAGSESPSGMAGDAEVDLDALARATVAAFEPLASEHEAVLRTGRTEGGTVRADAERLGQALGILVHNALAHGGPSVAVEVGASREGRTAVLEVRDDGPGIAAADRQRVIERFSRGDPARSSHGGSGLGLAICRAIAEAHGGRLVLGPASSDPARPGLAARIEVPLRRGSAAEQAGG